MEGTPGKPLIKSEETLKQQLVLTNEVSENMKVSIPDSYKEYPLTSLVEIVKELQQKQLHELNYEEYQLVTQYPLYLDNLRTLRQEQGNQIHAALEQAESEDERREAFLSSISWSGPIQKKILEKMESGGYSLDTKTFTDTQIAEASRTREGFVGILDMYTSLRPDVLIGSLSKLSSLLTHDEISGLIDECLHKKPSLVALYYPQLFQFYGDKFKEVFIRNAVESKNQSFINSLAKNDDLRGLIGQEQAVEITSALIAQDLSILDSYRSEDIWKSGLVNMELLNEILATKLPLYSESRVVSFIHDMWPYLDETGKAICKDVAEKRLQSENHSYLDLRSYEGVVDEEVLREKARAILLSSTDRHTISNLRYLEQNLSPDELRQWMDEYLHDGKENYRLDGPCSEDLMHSDVLTEADKMLFVERQLNENPRQIFTDPDTFLAGYTPEVRQKIMVRLGGEASGYDGVEMLPEWLPYMASSAEEQKAILIEHCLKDSDLTFLSWYQDEAQNKPHQVLFRSLISKSDLITIIEKKAEVNTSAVLRKTDEIRTLLGGDENLKLLIDRLYISSPFAFFESFDSVAYLYTPLELELIIWEHIGTFKYGFEIFKNIHVWGPRLGEEKMKEICEANMNTLCLTPSGLKAYLEIAPERSFSDFIPVIIKSNPAVALYFLHGSREGEEYRKAGVSISPEEIRDTALIEAESSPLRNTLKEFWSTVDIKNVADPEFNLATMRQTFYLYIHLAELTRAGLSETLGNVLEAKEHNSDEEQRVLQNLVSYVHLQRMGAVDGEGISRLQTSEDIEAALFSGMAQVLSGKVEVDESHRAMFLNVMKTPGPFISYLTQYSHSSEHKKLLTDIFESITEGEFSAWKYGSKEEFDGLRTEGLLPSETNEAQYETWKVDEQTALFETLKASGEEVAEHINKLLVHNAEYLGVQNFEDSVKEPLASLGEVKQELKLLGPRLAELGKQLSLLSKNPEIPEETKRVTQVEKANLEQLRNLLTLNRDLIRLASLTPQEIMSGYFIEAGKQTQSMDKFLTDLRDRVPNEGQFVIDQIIAQVDSLRAQGAEKENIICEDTADPKITLEVGALPVESCQHYENGSYNECLLGYTEPNTKVLVVRNGKDNIIARSIVRLLSVEGGKPALHVERIYSTSAGAGVKKAIFEHAYNKAISLNVPLLANTEDIPTNLNFNAGEKIELVSHASRAPKVYVDSAGGSKSWGKYRISSASIITRSK